MLNNNYNNNRHHEGSWCQPLDDLHSFFQSYVMSSSLLWCLVQVLWLCLYMSIDPLLSFPWYLASSREQLEFRPHDQNIRIFFVERLPLSSFFTLEVSAVLCNCIISLVGISFTSRFLIIVQHSLSLVCFIVRFTLSFVYFLISLLLDFLVTFSIGSTVALFE